MGKSAPFRLNRNGLLLALVSAAFAGEAGAAGGRVDFATAGTTISGADGQSRPLTKGTELGTGDTVRTDTGGRAQIRFPDGAYVSLQPNTEFSVKEYNFDGKADGTERGFFGLAKGAMRTVTGLIGRVNKNRYQIATPTATIGIRGTGGMISIGTDGSTLVTGTSGIWTITNPSGTIDVPAGSVGKAPSAPNQPPQQTTEKPSTGPTQPVTTTQYTQAGNVTPDGTPADLAPTTPPIIPLASGNGYAASAALSWFSSGTLQSNGNAAATFNPTGQLTAITYSDGQIFRLDPTTGSHAEFGTNGILAWGRWIGGVTGLVNTDGLLTLNENYGAQQGLHYVVGMPTPVASLPTNGSFTFNLLGATSPTYTNGGVPPGTVTAASLTANFLTGAVAVSMAAVDGNGLGYNVNNATGSMNASVPGALFNTSGSGTGTGCPNGCGFTANGFFAGTGATNAGYGYQFNNTAQGSNLIGAVAVKR